MKLSKNINDALDVGSEFQKKLERESHFQKSLEHKLSLVKNCIGPLSTFAYPSDAVGKDLRCAVGAELWKYGVLALTKEAFDEAYDVLEKVIKDGERLPFTVINPNDATDLLADIDVGAENLEWKAQVISWDALSTHQKRTTLLVLGKASGKTEESINEEEV